MTATCDRRLSEALRLIVPGGDLIAPGFVGLWRASALAQAEAAFHRINARDGAVE